VISAYLPHGAIQLAFKPEKSNCASKAKGHRHHRALSMSTFRPAPHFDRHLEAFGDAQIEITIWSPTGLPSRADIRRPVSRVGAILAIPISILTAIRGSLWSDPTIHWWRVMDRWRLRRPINPWRWRDILDWRGILGIVIAVVIAPVPRIPSHLLAMWRFHSRS